ncbi:SLC13 family permease [Chloroflexota bacterium]
MSLILTLIVLVATIGLFISGRLRPDLIAISALIALVILGLISPDQSLYGFANQATITIGAMFIVSMGLVRTGLVQWVAYRIERLVGNSELTLLLVLCTIIAMLSAFLVNTAIVAIFIPVVISITKTKKIALSRILIPLSFASQFGGVCTIIGSSTNMLVNGISISQGMQPFGFFEFAALGIVMVVVGILYLLIFGRWLLPKRKGEASQIDKYSLADYTAELQVLGNSVLVGKTWRENKISRDAKIDLPNLIREGKSVARPQTTKIRPGDLLILRGNIELIIEKENEYSLEIMRQSKFLDQGRSHEIQLVEALIPPNSNLIGRTLQNSDFFRHYKATILAIQRRGKTLKDRLADIKLNNGDTLLIHGHKDDVLSLINSANVIVTDKLTDLIFRKDKAIYALIITLAIILLSVFKVTPIMVAAMIGAVSMVLTRCITLEETYNAIDWKIIFLLGGIIPLGIAIEQNGLATLFSANVLNALLRYGPIVLLAITYITVAVLTEGISNNAAAAIMAPIVINLASSMNIDPRPFLVAVTFAASTSFATPVGYQTNTMIYSPGGYHFGDFARIGIPLNIIFWILATALIPLIWPF